MNIYDKVILVVFKDWCFKNGLKEFEGVNILRDNKINEGLK